MKAAGYLVRVDNLGRIVIPVRIRRSMELESDTCLELFTEEDRIVMQKYQDTCVFCGKDEDLLEYKDKHICADCLKALKK
ncbi:MAG: AbrB family transcriptional regulator [Ruminococcus sp.]|nr:AbrB family transcriptional regulator [Ruminococcus sp.]